MYLCAEGMNGMLLNHIHGTQYIGLQCAQKFSILQGFPPPEEMPTIVDRMAGSLLQRGPEVKPLGRVNSELLPEEQAV